MSARSTLRCMATAAKTSSFSIASSPGTETVHDFEMPWLLSYSQGFSRLAIYGNEYQTVTVVP